MIVFQKTVIICTKFSLEKYGLVKFSTESNERQPRGREEKEKLTHIQIRCNLLDFYSFPSFLLSFQTNVSEDYSLLLQGFKGSVKETNKMLPFSLLTVFKLSFFLSRSI